MIQRATILALANWALLVLPCICTGGYLRHACGCAGAADSGCCKTEVECNGDGSTERTGCGHESSCENDPCAFVFARLEGPSTSFAAMASEPNCLVVIPAADPHEWPEFVRRELVRSAWRDKHIPFHESDVPLLI